MVLQVQRQRPLQKIPNAQDTHQWEKCTKTWIKWRHLSLDNRIIIIREVANMSGSFICSISTHFQRQTRHASDCCQVCAPPAPVEWEAGQSSVHAGNIRRSLKETHNNVWLILLTATNDSAEGKIQWWGKSQNAPTKFQKIIQLKNCL